MSFKTLAPHVARVVLALAFFVFGLNGFLRFIPMPPAPEGAMKLIEAMIGSGYLMAFVKGTEVAMGVLLLSNRLVPLALVVLAPVVLNIVAFHFFLEPASTLAMPLFLMGLQVYLAWVNRAAYAPLFAPRAAAQHAAFPVSGPVTAR